MQIYMMFVLNETKVNIVFFMMKTGLETNIERERIGWQKISLKAGIGVVNLIMYYSSRLFTKMV